MLSCTNDMLEQETWWLSPFSNLARDENPEVIDLSEGDVVQNLDT